MPVVVKIAAKPLNQSGLIEELRALPFAAVTGRIDWYGFDRASARTLAPIAARKKVGEANGVADFADPGEVRFHTTRDLTAQENTALDAALAAHSAANLSPEQAREDVDEDDLTQLVAALAVLDTDISAYDAAANAQKFVILGRALRIQRRALRIIIRKFRSAAV